jgi:hypothetical protein
MTGRWLGFIRCIVGAVGFGRIVAVRRGLRRGVVAGRLAQKDGRFPSLWMGAFMFGADGRDVGSGERGLDFVVSFVPCGLADLVSCFARPSATPDLLFLLCVACSALSRRVGDDEPSPARHRRDRLALGPQASQHNGWSLWYKAVPCAVPFCRRQGASTC